MAIDDKINYQQIAENNKELGLLGVYLGLELFIDLSLFLRDHSSAIFVYYADFASVKLGFLTYLFGDFSHYRSCFRN